jgi:lysophospholipase L1-like esterase
VNTHPPSWNLRLWADRLRAHRKCFCAIMGDSTCATNQGGGSGGQARWAYGIIRAWDVAWAQMVVWDLSTAGAEGGNSLFLPASGIDAGGLLADGVTANPFCLALVEDTLTSGSAHGNLLIGRTYVQLTWAGYLRGDWTAGRTLRVTRLNTSSTATWSVGCQQVVFSTGESDIVHSVAMWGGVAGARSSVTTADFTRNSTPATDVFIQIYNHAAGGPLYSNQYKTILRLNDAPTRLGIDRGFGWASISQGGWTSRSHLDNYSTQALAFEITACDLDVVIIQVGINVAPGEASGGLPTATFEANYRELLTKVHAAFALAGKTDYAVVCQVPWQSGPASDYQTAQSELVRRVAGEFPRTCFVSIDSLLRLSRGEAWYGAAGSPVLADGVHQSTSGATEMAGLLMAECRSKQTPPRGRARAGRRAA